MTPVLTSSTFEHSMTVTRNNGTKLDFCAFKCEKALVIGAVDANGNPLQEILLSDQEAGMLLDHLLDQRTQSALA